MTRKQISATVRYEVLLEAGYKCANPTCRNILTLQLHHMVWVKDGGENSAENLIALCGHCHDMHTQGHIPSSAITHWKGMLHALNHAFSKESTDLLLYLYKRDNSIPHWYSADGVLRFAGLYAAGLVKFTGGAGINMINIRTGSSPSSSHQIDLSDKGRILIEAWLEGDEQKFGEAIKIHHCP